jgi:hypothetical protein
MKLVFFVALALVSQIRAQIAPQPLPQIEHLSGNNYAFSWDGIPGRAYFMQVSSQPPSSSGFSWDFVPDIRVGTGHPLSMGFEANASNSEFFRLVYFDYAIGEDPYFGDFDNDGFTNLEEALENANPFDPLVIPIIYSGVGGSGNGGSSGNGGGQSGYPWEYKITYSIDSNPVVDFFNPDNAPRAYTYALGENINVELNFEDVIDENQAGFLQIQPNLQWDPNTTGSEKWDVIGKVILSEQNPDWSFTGQPYTLPVGYLLPIEEAPEVLDVNSDFDEGRVDTATGYAIPDCDDVYNVDRKTGPEMGI